MSENTHIPEDFTAAGMKKASKMKQKSAQIPPKNLPKNMKIEEKTMKNTLKKDEQKRTVSHSMLHRKYTFS